MMPWEEAAEARKAQEVTRTGTQPWEQPAMPAPAPAPMVPTPPPQPMPLMSAARGLTYGATMNVARPAASVLMVGLDKLLGEGKLTRKEALEILSEQEAADRAANPFYYGAGQLGGAVALPGAALAKLAARVPALGTVGGVAGTGAVTGGIGALAESEDPTKTLYGATLGALTGGLVGGAFQGAKKGIDEALRIDAARQIEKIITGKQKDARQTLEAILGKDVIRDYGGDSFKAAKEIIVDLKKGAFSASENPKLVKTIENLANISRGERIANIGAAAIRGAGGATAGGGLELLSGGFIPPGLAAAGLGLYGAKEQLGRLGIEEARRLGVRLGTQQASPIAQAVGGGGTVRVVPTPSPTAAGVAATAAPLAQSPLPTGTPLVPAPGEVYTPIMSPEESMTPLPPLRQLAREFRQRFGGQ